MIGVKWDGRRGSASDFVEFKIEDVNFISVQQPKSKYQVPVYHTSQGSFVPLLTIRDLTAALAVKGFVRMDRSHLVNRSRIKRVIHFRGGRKIVFIDSLEVVISRSRRK